MMTSNEGVSVPTTDEVFTETTDDGLSLNPKHLWWLKVAGILVVNALLTFCLAQYYFSHQDGMQRIGWTQNVVRLNDRNVVTFMPVYVVSKDYRELSGVK